MGSDDAKTALIKQMQFPVGVLACLQAGSIFYLAIYFDFIQEKYRIKDEVFAWFEFMLNSFSLFGVLPGILLKWLKPKKTAIFGGVLIVIGQMLTVLLISSEHDKVKENPEWLLGSICVITGQGACMVLLACLQALMNMQTIQASHVISTCLLAYFLGADSFIMSIKDGLFETTSFTNFTMGLAIAAFILTMLNALVITDEEDSEGFFGKAIALTKGVIYKKTNYLHLVILAVYMGVLSYSYFEEGLADQTAAISLSALVLLNLFVPISLVFLMDPDRIKSLVGEPSDIEKQMSKKGTDLTFSEAAQRLDFWYMSICAMIVVGASRLFDGNALALGMHDEKSEEMIQ